MENRNIRNNETNINWKVRAAFAILLLLAVLTISITNRYLTERFTETTRNRAELRLALYSGNLMSELHKNAIVPQLLALDPTLISALNSGDYSQSTQRLLSFVEEIGAVSLVLLDQDGRTVAATDRNRIGENHHDDSYFLDALRGQNTVFTIQPLQTGGVGFYYTRRIQSGGSVIGVIAVEVDLQRFERAWAGIADAVIVTDSEGQIILATESQWRGRAEEEALSLETPQGAIAQAIRVTSEWASPTSDVYLQGEAVMRLEKRVSFRGWRMILFTTYTSVRERVNSILALEIMGFAILMALAFYALSRRNAFQMLLFQRESADLRALNLRLQREISERERMQKNLEVAEQTLEQSSKLAALGEMSAAVSHELNQPLAAMKTYLAGARLLLGRNRPDEALSSFGRIDGLIERMGAITRQLKSYARKGADELSPVDLRQALASSLSMMEPQLRQRLVQISQAIPDEPVLVLGDLMRIEQVMVNLLRNALDATKSERNPKVEIILSKGDMAVLTVHDNGTGIETKDKLFEPFFTTKQPGDGVGLGLAISSGIVSDLGGRLLARNGQLGGAVFEMQLPIITNPSETQNAQPSNNREVNAPAAE